MKTTGGFERESFNVNMEKNGENQLDGTYNKF